jgi:hypothetical protein
MSCNHGDDQDQKQLGNTQWGIADQLRGAMNIDDFHFRDWFPHPSVGTQSLIAPAATTHSWSYANGVPMLERGNHHNHKRKLSLTMIRNLHAQSIVPYDSLLGA